MKKLAFVFVGFLAAILFAIFAFPKTYRVNLPVEKGAQVAPVVTLTIDFGDAVSTVSSVRAATAYDALLFAAAKENVSVVTKKYDFGVFVESIGDKKSSAEKAWIFFVNGESGKEAADKTEVQSGDSVEWKYIKPTMQ